MNFQFLCSVWPDFSKLIVDGIQIYFARRNAWIVAVFQTPTEDPRILQAKAVCWLLWKDGSTCKSAGRSCSQHCEELGASEALFHLAQEVWKIGNKMCRLRREEHLSSPIPFFWRNVLACQKRVLEALYTEKVGKCPDRSLVKSTQTSQRVFVWVKYYQKCLALFPSARKAFKKLDMTVGIEIALVRSNYEW